MKKTLLVITTMIMSIGAYAQTEQQPPVGSDTTQWQTSTRKYPDGFLMKNGKVMHIKNQKMIVLKNDTTLANGTQVMRDGNYIKQGGTKVMLKEGQHLDLTGKMILISGLDEKKKMYLVNDTIKNKKN